MKTESLKNHCCPSKGIESGNDRAPFETLSDRDLSDHPLILVRKLRWAEPELKSLMELKRAEVRN